MTPGPPGTAERAPAGEEAPPFFGSWKRLYTAVFVYLATLIALLYAFSEIFS
jgi:hypothetical protein